jgi:putative SOS response-associated peptidase YedK
LLSREVIIMCGRFTLRTPLSTLIQQFQLAESPQVQLPLRFNIAPTQDVAAIRVAAAGGPRQLGLLRWGLIPSWAKDPAMGARMINARAETVSEKPSFRAAFRRRRCLVPADGFYEWKKIGRKKQPYYFRRRDDRPFALAGLWEQWWDNRERDGEPLETCTIITTEANELSQPIHDRMPVILDATDYDLWLDPDAQDKEPLQALLQPYDASQLRADPVSTHVNNVRHDDPQCIEVQPELF